MRGLQRGGGSGPGGGGNIPRRGYSKIEDTAEDADRGARAPECIIQQERERVQQVSKRVTQDSAEAGK